jgi:hypothetical protein
LGARSDGNAVRGLHHRKLYAVLLQKTPQDEHFLPVGAAPQQEQIAGPKAWDQIRSRKAITTFYGQNCDQRKISHLADVPLRPRAKRESSPHTTPFLGIVSSFSQWVAGFPQGLGYAKMAIVHRSFR